MTVPDGQRIVYWSSDGRIEYRPKEDFTRDTPLEARIVFVPMSELIPMWSPDGSWVAFTRDGSREVWVVNADGGTPTRITVNTLPKEGR